jgi:hypothetical protein
MSLDSHYTYESVLGGVGYANFADYLCAVVCDHRFGAAIGDAVVQ